MQFNDDDCDGFHGVHGFHDENDQNDDQHVLVAVESGDDGLL